MLLRYFTERELKQLRHPELSSLKDSTSARACKTDRPALDCRGCTIKQPAGSLSLNRPRKDTIQAPMSGDMPRWIPLRLSCGRGWARLQTAGWTGSHTSTHAIWRDRPSDLDTLKLLSQNRNMVRNDRRWWGLRSRQRCKGIA